jgi:hypothetical protein
MTTKNKGWIHTKDGWLWVKCENVFEQIGFSKKEAARLHSVAMARITDERLQRHRIKPWAKLRRIFDQ